MAQSTLDDDDLFGEAASEMRADVEESLAAARDALPAAGAIWDLEADNTLGALNALRSALDAEGAADHLRDAKKWYTMGDRADAFDDAADLEASIDELEGILADVDATRERVGELTRTIPELRSELEDLSADGDGEPETEADAGSEAEA